MISTTAPVASRRPRVLLVAADVVGTQMAGPGLRFVAIAQQLATVADVTLAVGIEGSDPASLAGRGFEVAAYDGRDALIALVRAHDIAFCQLIDEEVVREGLVAGCRFIFDLYNALPAEAIGADRIGGFDTQPEKDEVFAGVLGFFRFCMRTGSYFVTSNERQRDFWIGYMLSAEGLLPSELAGRRTSDVVGLVPFGMDGEEPTRTGPGLRERLGIDRGDIVLLWAGGIWDWFDAGTPIRAVAELRRRRPDVRLVFYGTRHPNALVGRPRSVEQAETLARELGVLDNGVHFIDGWVPASERANYLLDADVAISAHKESFETRYAFRTRILDHFWATLPSIVTEGDWFAEYIEANDLGQVVPYGDVPRTVEAIDRLDDAFLDMQRAKVREIRDDWRWTATTRQLTRIVAEWETELVPRRPLPAPPASVAEEPPAAGGGLRARLSPTVIGRLWRRGRRLLRP